MYPSPLRSVSDLNVRSVLKLNNLKIGEGNAVVLPSGEFHGFELSPRSHTIARCMIAYSGLATLLRWLSTMRLASGCMRCDPVSLVTLMQPEIYCRWLCADGSTRCRRMRRRRRWALAHGYRTAAIDWRDRDVVLDVSLLSMPNTVLYLLVEERISSHRSPFLRPTIDLSLSLL